MGIGRLHRAFPGAGEYAIMSIVVRNGQVGMFVQGRSTKAEEM